MRGASGSGKGPNCCDLVELNALRNNFQARTVAQMRRAYGQLPNESVGSACRLALLNQLKESEMAIREEYLALLERQLNDGKAYTERIKAKADQLEAQANAQFDKQLELIRAKQNEAWDNFLKLKGTSEDTWSQWKSLDKAWDAMKAAADGLRINSERNRRRRVRPRRNW
jgi:vancomycin resistance protein YoaR